MKRLNVPALVTIALAAFFCLRASGETATIGQPAPALTFTDLLQAPAGTKADWPSLRGKVVVLEFWATWCAGCIEQIPHLNKLVQTLGSASGPGKVQFIAVDDEDPALVKKFLGKTPIDGWLGIDTTQKIIDAYGASVRPRTVVVDTQGRIAGIVDPHQLTGEQLLALADGKPVVFPASQTAATRQEAFKEADAAANAISSGGTGSKPIFDISIRPGDPAGKVAIAHRGGKNDDSYSIDFLNMPLDTLLKAAAGIQGSRLTIHGGTDTKYSLHVSAPGGDIEQLAQALQMAIVTATGMTLSHASAIEDAYVLEATPKAASLLPPSTSDQSMCFYNKQAGKLVMMQSSLDSLAQTLEPILGALVVNETGLKGNFDANFSVPKGDVDAARAALETNLGLTLVKARRSIDRIVLDPLPPPAEKAANLPAKPEPVPGQLIQTVAVPHE